MPNATYIFGLNPMPFSSLFKYWEFSLNIFLLKNIILNEIT